MELQEFITESLTQIMAGVAAAAEAAKEHGALINPRMTHEGGDKRALVMTGSGPSFAETVHFDIAVTVTEGTESKAGIGIFAGAVGLGAKGATAAETSSVSRLKFNVPIAFPMATEE